MYLSPAQRAVLIWSTNVTGRWCLSRVRKAYVPRQVRLITLPPVVRLVRTVGAPQSTSGLIFGHLRQAYAVDRTGCKAQLAAAARARDNDMQKAARPDNRIHRADIDALAATDAVLLVDDSTPACSFTAVLRIERFDGTVQQCRQRFDGRIGTRRAAVYVRFAAGDGLGVCAAAGIAAAHALGLRQPCVDQHSQWWIGGPA